MILASHVIFSCYGFWLPNDPRGSWSEFVASWELFRYGSATKTTETCSLAYRQHDRELRLAAKEGLKFPAVALTGIQARAVGRGFGSYAQKSDLQVWACAVLPDHVHLVLARHRLKAESLVVQLKGHASQQLLAEGIHPFGQVKEEKGKLPKCFARGEWKVFLDSLEAIVRAIRYVENNPLKEGKPRQHWHFVRPYPG